MSEKRQREARDRREAALERERAARRRAAGADERGNDSAAESQRTAADAHRQAATAAEALRRADVAIEGERIGEPARGVSRADSESSPPGGSVNSPPQRAELDSAITDAVSHAAAVAQAAHDAAQMAIEILASVAALLEERSRAHDVGSAQRADTRPVDKSVDALPADVLEIAVLDAHAGGVSLADYLRDAVLSYGAGSHDRAGGELDARLSAARRKAAQLQAQSRAVQAQNTQVTGRRSPPRAAKPPDSGPGRRAGNGAEDDPEREER